MESMRCIGTRKKTFEARGVWSLSLILRENNYREKVGSHICCDLTTKLLTPQSWPPKFSVIAKISLCSNFLNITN